MKKSFSLRTIALLSAMIFGVTGCGTIIHGTRQNVRINSVPADATVIVDGIKEVHTPATVSLARAKDHTISVEKKGCKKSQVQIERDFNAVPTILGNIFWLIPGLAVDFIAGGAWTLQPEAVDVPLSC